MWRFSKTNSITEGLHRRMDEIQNRAYGMHNFENYRIRLKTYCSKQNCLLPLPLEKNLFKLAERGRQSASHLIYCGSIF
jgi:hypothetical protein